MAGKIIIVGAGIIGSALALRLARVGCQVTVVSAGAPAATTASFGWINASFYLDDAHHRLRAAGIAAWHRLAQEVDIGIRWSGCLCWDMPPDELDQTYARLQGHGYAVERLTRAQVAACEPALRRLPDAALFFPAEGAAPSADVPARLLAAAQAAGAKVLRDVPVIRVVQDDSGDAGVETKLGVLMADQVVLAAGTGTAALAATVGGLVPLVHRPAYILRSTAQRPMLQHILASPIGEIRQESSGAILMPAAVNHQADTTETLAQDPVTAAEQTIARLRDLLHGAETLDWAEVTYAERPVPSDGQPVVGPVAAGVYAACLHSGITLGPVVAELASQDILGRLDHAAATMLAPYRPNRFAPAP